MRYYELGVGGWVGGLLTYRPVGVDLAAVVDSSDLEEVGVCVGGWVDELIRGGEPSSFDSVGL